MKKFICLSLAVIAVLAVFAGCTGKKNEEPFDPETAFAKLLSDVKYDAELKDEAEYAEFVFGDAVKDGMVMMYDAGDMSADAVIYFKVNDPAYTNDVLKAVNEYLSARKLEADRYNPEESKKIEKAVIWSDDTHVIVCVSSDWETARKILFY